MRMRMVTCGLLAAAIAGAAVSAAPEDKAANVLAAARKAIGDKKLDSLKTLAVEAAVQRNVSTMQMTADVEVLLELPDKYIRTDTSSGPMGGFSIGFNGSKPIRPANAVGMAGGAMVIRMGPGPGPGGPAPEKLSPEDQARVDAQLVRSQRAELSRLMLGWFAAAHPALNAQYTYGGEAESPDGKADVIDVKADGFNARLFIDQQTRLPLMVTYQGPQPRMITAGGPMAGGARAATRPGGTQAQERGEPTAEERQRAREAADRQVHELQTQPPTMVEMTLFFDDWRDAGGIKFPHNIRRASAGTTNEEWTVNKVRVNPKIDARQFEG